MYICTPSIMKAAEKAAVDKGTDYGTLMENAGRAAAEAIYSDLGSGSKRSAVILCGKGNNGGDGFVTAYALLEKGWKISVLLACGRPATNIASEKLARLEADGRAEFITAKELMTKGSSFDAAVDAVFGTGFHGELPDDIANLFTILETHDLPVYAEDIPSGLNAADGSAAADTPRCRMTVTFGAPKAGMYFSKGKAFCGDILIRDIGIDDDCLKAAGAAKVLTDSYIQNYLPSRPENAHKGMYGKLLIVGGCEKMSGAAALNVKAALRSGAGIVRLASVEKVIDRTAAHIYESTYIPLKADENGSVSADSLPDILDALENSTVCAAGSGLSVTDGTKSVVKVIAKFCSDKNIPLILDADGLNCLEGCIECIRNAKCIITPHVGEAARLLGLSNAEVSKDRLSAAVKLSALTGAVTVMKGYPTYICHDGRSYACFSGNAGLSRGGSGDVLTGIISGLCAAGLSPDKAAACGVLAFGRAADITAEKLSLTGMLPSDVIEQLPFAFRYMDR